MSKPFVTTLFHLLSILFLSLPFSSHGKELCHPSDKRALLQIKAALNATLPTWDPATDCCTWDAVDCDPTTHRIVNLQLWDAQEISGQIPSAISELTYLQTLYLHKTSITGSIPPSITKLKYLRWLELSWNYLSGPIPEYLGQLKSLTYLDLSFNQFTGSIPASLSNLNKLTGLRLDRNNLTGTIPESFGQFGSQMNYLQLSHNQLRGEVPRSLGNIDFNLIDLSRNELQGDASFLFGVNKTLATINLSRNLFEFDFSKVGVPSSLFVLDLNHNKIFGSLPEGLVLITATLNNFNVSYNRLCGEIPTGGNLQSFGYSAFSHNKCLCGPPLPVC